MQTPIEQAKCETATFESFQTLLLNKVQAFGNQIKVVKGDDYDEAKVRSDFLDPFFRALGWDLENNAHLIPQHREVEIESRTIIDGRKKRADYLFRTDRKDRFVCEAKKPKEQLNARHAFQAKRYAWNKGVVLAVLSTFEETRIYVVGSRPHPDEGTVGLWKTWRFEEYPNAAREMWNLLAHETVATGSIDKLVEQLPHTPVGKGKARQQWLFKPDRSRALDTDFLNFLDEARRELASDLLRHNDRKDLLEGTRLNEATQRILDRLLFIRICEDRDIDTGRPLAQILRSWRDHAASPVPRKPRQSQLAIGETATETYTVRPRPGPLWREVVAHFQALDRRPPSHIPFFNGNLFKPHFSEELEIGDEWLAGFLDEIGDEESPYLFNVIPVEILGTIYERFLGKVVRPQGRGVTIEEKPEVRKAGGVYYTPRYIVDYIVEQTVGKLLADRKPEKTLDLRLLDPACGSGSFLIRAFERVCEHWQTALTKGERKRRRQECWTDPATGDVHLTTDLKRRILTANIYGVDIDPGAVEVTQLSLYLKMLEGENRTTLAAERDLFGSDIALLPPLQDNIKCGNSLIASDFSIIREDLVRVNAFDWDVQFVSTMKAGGFDAVIGNPPYILLQNMSDPNVFSYLADKFVVARYKIDTYQVFMERAIRLAGSGGMFGFITPNSYLRNKHAVALRSFILDCTDISSLRTFYYPVFSGASVDTCILVARKAQHPSNATEILVIRSESPEGISGQKVTQQEWRKHAQKNFFLPSSGAEDALLAKIDNKAFPLGEIATAYFGIQTYDREKYVTGKRSMKAHKSVVDGGNIQRYDLLPSTEFVDFRPASIKSGGKEMVYETERIGVRQIGKTPIGTIVPAGLYSLNTIYNIYFTKPTLLSLRFVLGLMASSTGRWFWERRFFDQKETFPKIKKDALLMFPVVKLDLSSPADLARHDRMVALVEKMLALAPKLRQAKSEEERRTMRNAVTATDRQIDTLVYELYGLTPEEIALVDGIGKSDGGASVW